MSFEQKIEDTIQQSVRASKFINNLYFYLEEKKVDLSLVEVTQINDELQIVIQPEVPSNVSEEIIKMAEDFELGKDLVDEI